MRICVLGDQSGTDVVATNCVETMDGSEGVTFNIVSSFMGKDTVSAVARGVEIDELDTLEDVDASAGERVDDDDN